MRRTDTSYQFIGRMYVVVGIQPGSVHLIGDGILGCGDSKTHISRT